MENVSKAKVTAHEDGTDIRFTIEAGYPVDTGAGTIMFQENVLIFRFKIDGSVTITAGRDHIRIVKLNGEVQDPMDLFFELAEGDVITVTTYKERGDENVVTYTIDQINVVEAEDDPAEEPTDDGPPEPEEVTDTGIFQIHGYTLLGVESDAPERDVLIEIPSSGDGGHDNEDPTIGPQEAVIKLVPKKGKPKYCYVKNGMEKQLPYPFDKLSVRFINNRAVVSIDRFINRQSGYTKWSNKNGVRLYGIGEITQLKQGDEIETPTGIVIFLYVKTVEESLRRRWHDTTQLITAAANNWMNEHSLSLLIIPLALLLAYLIAIMGFSYFDPIFRNQTAMEVSARGWNLGTIIAEFGQRMADTNAQRYFAAEEEYNRLQQEEIEDDQSATMTATETPVPATATPTPRPTATSLYFGMYEHLLPKEVLAGEQVTITGYFPAGTEFSLYDDSGYLWGSTEVDVFIQTVTFKVPETMQGEIKIVATHGNRQDELTVQVISPFGCPIFTDPGPGRFTLNYWVNVPSGEDNVPFTPTEGHLFQCHMRETDPYIVFFNPEAGKISFDSRQRLAPTGPGINNFVVELVFEMDVTPESDYEFILEHDDGVQIEIIDAETTAPVYFYRNWQIGATHHEGTLGIHEGTQKVVMSIKLFEWDNRGLSKLIFICPTCWQQPEVETITTVPSAVFAQPTATPFQFGPFDQIEITDVRINNRGGYYEVVVDTNDPLTDRWNTWVHTWADGCQGDGSADRIDGTATTYRTSNFYPSSEAWGSCTFHVELRNDNSTHTYDTYEVVYHFDRVEAVNGPPPVLPTPTPVIP